MQKCLTVRMEILLAAENTSRPPFLYCFSLRLSVMTLWFYGHKSKLNVNHFDVTVSFRFLTEIGTVIQSESTSLKMYSRGVTFAYTRKNGKIMRACDWKYTAANKRRLSMRIMSWRFLLWFFVVIFWETNIENIFSHIRVMSWWFLLKTSNNKVKV